MARRTLATAGIILLLSIGAFGGQPKGTSGVGIRLGFYDQSHNQIDLSKSDVQVFANRNVIYIEAYVNYYVTDYLALVANLASYSKGDIRFDLYQRFNLLRNLRRAGDCLSNTSRTEIIAFHGAFPDP